MDSDAILLHLIIDLVIIIAAARSLGWLALRINQPAVVGKVLAGIILGPTVIGRIWPSVPGRLFPNEVPLQSFADIGLVFFMFLVGLELNPELMRKEGRRALQISLSGIITPFILGILLATRMTGVNNGGHFADPTKAHPPTPPTPSSSARRCASPPSRCSPGCSLRPGSTNAPSAAPPSAPPWMTPSPGFCSRASSA